MDLASLIGFGLFVVFIIGLIIWLIKDYRKEKRLQDKIKQ
jgi:hypothetical protein